MAVILVTKAEIGFKSIPIPFLPNFIASIGVGPEPQKGSKTISFSFV